SLVDLADRVRRPHHGLLGSGIARNARQRIVIWAVALPLMTVTGALFSAGADIYLVATAALLLVQRMVVAGDFNRLRLACQRRPPAHGIIVLDDVARLADHGQKAFRLARMRAEGMLVPDGLLLPPNYLEEFASISAERRAVQLDAVWRQLGQQRVAVR